MAEPTEVEITVAGHSVTIKAAEPLAEVATMALSLFRATSIDAERAPIGFDITGGHIELGPAEGTD